ncbi:hypothetical protein F4604DRAFT_1959117 [Suillus subluteus]|nr:hypothetical protein F4604DRAFT_1959117 [Suillus subluteus]
MTLDDWSIFCKYNYRVQSLVHRCRESYSHTDDETIGTEIWRALSCPPFSLPLLPNLTSLTWTEASDKTFQYIRLFATPKLTMLNIFPRYCPSFTFGPSDQFILSSIAQSCPSVSYFDFIQDSYNFIEPVGDRSTALQFWSHLTSVKTGMVSEGAILHLSNLPSLRVLEFTLPSTSISTDAQKLLQRPAFCALQELNVTCNSLVILDAFLEKLTVTPKVLSFAITRGLTARAAAFQPLFAFRNLRTLDFTADHYWIVRMDDASLLQMAKAWPYLEELYISRYTYSIYRVTLHAFVLLLRHCPHLRSVAVLVDWSMIDVCDISPDIPYQGFSHHALSYIFVSDSKIQNPTSIAAFISAIAPNVQFIGGSEKRSWEIVQDHLTRNFAHGPRDAGNEEVSIDGDVGEERVEEESGSEDGYMLHFNLVSSDFGEEESRKHV